MVQLRYHTKYKSSGGSFFQGFCIAVTSFLIVDVFDFCR